MTSGALARSRCRRAHPRVGSQGHTPRPVSGISWQTPRIIAISPQNSRGILLAMKPIGGDDAHCLPAHTTDRDRDTDRLVRSRLLRAPAPRRRPDRFCRRPTINTGPRNSSDGPGHDASSLPHARLGGRPSLEAYSHLFVKLKAAIPVYLGYWTARVTPDRVVQFRKDVYGIDGRQTRSWPNGWRE